MRILSHILALIAALAIAHPVAYASHDLAETAETTKTASVVNAGRASAPPAASEDEEGWACWAQGNRMCSRVPLGHRDGPTTGTNLQVTGVPPVCSTDADCDEWDRRHGIRGVRPLEE